jgi:ABC-type uncharacterized transport system substrate-binding protein
MRHPILASLAVCAVLLLLASCGSGPAQVEDTIWTAENAAAPAKKTVDRGTAMDFARQATAQESDTYRPPFNKEGGGKFRLAVVVSGSYWEFYDALKALVEAFGTIGWANKITIPASITTTDELIGFVANSEYSNYIEFSRSLYFDLKWGEDMGAMQKALIQGAARSGADVVLAYGGVAGSAFYKLDNYSLPVIMDAITDPLAAGVVKSNEDSGRDFVSCRVDPDQFKRQIRLFHDTVGFKKLGILYGDNENGRIWGAVRDVEEVAKERGFQIVRNTNVREEDSPETTAIYLKALDDICQKADAVYIGASAAITDYEIMPQVVAVLNKYRLPSFALEGAIRVKQGALFSISMAGITRSGIYNAKKIARVLAGAKPRDLPQIFENIPSIAINLKTAQAIGYDINIGILAGSDEVYTEIK